MVTLTKMLLTDTLFVMSYNVKPSWMSNARVAVKAAPPKIPAKGVDGSEPRRDTE